MPTDPHHNNAVSGNQPLGQESSKAREEDTNRASQPTGCPVPHGPGRRTFLAASLGALGVMGLAASCSQNGDSTQPDSSQGDTDGSEAVKGIRIPFTGKHQNTITSTPIARIGSLSAFRVTSPNREALQDMFAQLSVTIADLMAGRMPEVQDEAFPPAETGILGAELNPDGLGIVVSVGASLFDDRFGLADKKPKELIKMPFLANDRLDPERSHGDVLITVEANHEDTMHHAIRQIMRSVRRHLVLVWTVDGYARGIGGPGEETPRNLLGFKDGTANLDATDEELMNENVWVQAGDGEPDWAVGGSYHVVRVIRMLVEFWDRTRLSEQEAIFGRHKVSGAPLGQDNEFSAFSYDDDPDGDIIGLDAHIRLANPRTPETEGDLMLRRGFSYSLGVDKVGQLDQGLAFVSYQRQLQRFLNVQGRLNGEPLEEYIRPEGGGFYFAFPGVGDENTSLAAKLFA